MKKILFILMLLFVGMLSNNVLGQKTTVKGVIKDSITGETMPFVNILFQDTKTGANSDLEGNYLIESYYASDTLVFSFVGYKTKKVFVQVDKSQVINVAMEPSSEMLQAVDVLPPDENPAFKILRRVKRNKPINDKKKLESYQYETYNKMQFDLNNLTEKFKKRKIVQKLEIMDRYIDSSHGKKVLPVLLSESLSDIYYLKKINKKKEVMRANRVTGVENFELDQFTGEMYQDINIYENNLNLFNHHFISPISDHGRQHYKYYLEDSLMDGGHWCYYIRFKPKRVGQACFDGEMWIADTSYAVKRIRASIPQNINLNFVSNVEVEQTFNEVEPEVWMMTNETLLADLELYEGTKFFGIFAHKNTSRKNFIINKPKEEDFYIRGKAVEVLDSAKIQSEQFWESVRHDSLSKQEQGIIGMTDTMKQNKTFKFLESFSKMLFGGYYPYGPIEFGDLHSVVSFNRIEGFRTSLALRTSNSFSKIVELQGYGAYGFKDRKFKYGFQVRVNTFPKMRGLLTAYVNSDYEQLGATNDLAKVGNLAGSIFARGPIDRLTLVNKIGINYEKDWVPGFITFTSLEWKQYLPAGAIRYQRYNSEGVIEDINKIETAEVTMHLRYGKDEKFFAGVFNRKSLGSPKYPIINLRYTAGIKNVFSSDYNYHKLELGLEHKPKIGSLGRLVYDIYGGKIFGTVPYPFLKVHEGNQSYYLQLKAFNNMRFFEFVSDAYVGLNFEYHLLGLVMDRIPGIRNLKWRLVAHTKMTWGTLSDRHEEEMLIPNTTHRFGNVPYVEVGIGMENIFKFIRVDAVWRVTHLDKPGATPFGIRARFQFDF